MATIEAVTAALKAALDNAESSDEDDWDVAAANRWVVQLPPEQFANLSQLQLEPYDDAGQVPRHVFVAHTSATVAFLEAFAKSSGGNIFKMRG